MPRAPSPARLNLLKSLIEAGQIDDDAALFARFDWSTWWARENQIAPPGDWAVWMIMAGRGFGKTRLANEWVRDRIESGKSSRMALIAADAKDARDVVVEGESGLKAICPRSAWPTYNPSLKRLTWPNGAQAFLYSAEDPEELRGPQFDAAYCDELAKWRYQRETWDQLQFGLRLGDDPRVLVATTPRPTPLMKELILDGATVVTTGSTFDNKANLAPKFITRIRKMYDGTRLGRQELGGELLDDLPGALWSRDGIEKTRLRIDLEALVPGSIDAVKRTLSALPCELSRIVVAVDPPAKSTREADECGIVVAGVGVDGRGYVLEDASMKGTPDQWGTAAVEAADRWGADRIVYEENQGGEMVLFTIATCAKALKAAGKRGHDYVSTTPVWASRGKVVRAEPVGALYEQGRVSHVGQFAKLEDQMAEFTQAFDRDRAGYSPDRMDALVWAVTDLMLESAAQDGLADYAREEMAAMRAKLAPTAPTDLVKLKAPAGVNQASGLSGSLYAVDGDGHILAKPADVEAFLRAGFNAAT